jgi:hypothetical protein
VSPQLFLSGGLITAGAILRWAVTSAHPRNEHAVNLHTVGLILLLAGIVGAILDLLLWEPWGPAFLRRRVAYTDRPYRRARGRTVIDEEHAGPPPGPPPP